MIVSPGLVPEALFTAGRPTSICTLSPVLFGRLTFTTAGVRFSPTPLAMTRGLRAPSGQCAATEFVVPRSMPIAFTFVLPRTLRHHDTWTSQHPSIPLIAALDDFDDRTILVRIRFDHAHDLVLPWV